MQAFRFLLLLPAACLLSFTVTNPSPVKEYFSLPATLNYNKTSYQLSWSAHPSAVYYKQEYLPVGQTAAGFNKMLMIEAVTGQINAAEVVKAKINELEQRKQSDALANYQVIQNKATGEYLLDFIMSQSQGSKTALVEWNAYRYLPLKDKNGKKGILLLAISRRAYGETVPAFLRQLKTERTKDIAALAAYALPSVTLKTD